MKPTPAVYFVAGLAVAAGLASGLAAGAAAPSAGEADGAAPSAGEAAGEAVGDATGCGATPPSISERWPPPTPKPSSKATTKKVAAAPMVILARIVCVPRGPKAAEEIELVKSEPASALPGCRSTEMISTRQARIKIP